MKVNLPGIDIKKLPEELRVPFSPVAQSLDKVRDILRSIGIADNMNAALVDMSMTHATECPLSNPLQSRPVGFQPIAAYSLTTGLPVSIESYSGPNLSRTDRLLGITVGFAVTDPLHTYPLLGKTSAAFSVGNNSLTTVTGWSGAQFRGSVITESAGTWTLTETGSYQIAAWADYENGGGTYTRAYIGLDSGGGTIARSDGAVAWSAGPALNVGTVYQFAAGATFTVKAYQTNAAVAARSVNFRCSVQRIYNDTTYTAPTARVLGILWGG